MRAWIVVALSVALTSLLALARLAAAEDLILNIQDLAPFNYEVNGMVSGPAADVIRRVVKDLTIDMTPDDESAFCKLASCRVKAVFSNRNVGYDLLKKLGITNVRYSGRQQTLK